MRVAITGATGFIGHHILQRLAAAGHACRCWYRPGSHGGAAPGPEWAAGAEESVEWIPGNLSDAASAEVLVNGCDAVVHAALDRPGEGFRGAEGNVVSFVETNVVGTIRLIEAARQAGVPKFVFLSTCAVHEIILEDRPLDETHPLWPRTHYGAHKAAIEKFVHGYGMGMGYAICALRPSGVYGVHPSVASSKWFSLIQSVVRGQTVDCQRGGKEVHVTDVARAVEILLTAEGIAGQSFSCCDRYISEMEVATLAKSISGSDACITGSTPSPRHQIVTDKLERLGMEFGGVQHLQATVSQLIAQIPS